MTGGAVPEATSAESPLAPVDVVSWRLHTQGLVGPGFASPVDAVEALGAVQAQDHAIALWSLAQRVPGATVDQVQGLLDEGALLRTHILRPTWHYVAPADIRWMLDVTSPRVHVQNGTYYRRHGFDDDLYDRSHAVLRDAVGDGAHPTRAEVAEHLAAAGIAVSGMALEHLVMHAELEGVICSGPMRGRQQTYALLDDRAPAARTLDPDAALAELTRRYFVGHGPATVKDLRWWSSLTLAQIDAGLELVGDELHAEVIDGHTYLAGGPPPDLTASDAPEVLLLQALDELVVGYAESRDVVDLAGLEATHRDTPGLPSAVVLLDGQIAGRWRRKLRPAHLDVEVVAYRQLDDAERAGLQAEAARYATAHGREATLTVSAV